MYWSNNILIKNEDIFEDIADSLEVSETQVMSMASDAVYEHVNLMLGMIPPEVQGKVVAEIIPIYGSGFEISYKIRQEGASRTTGTVFVPTEGPSPRGSRGSYGESGHYVTGISRPAVTTAKMMEIEMAAVEATTITQEDSLIRAEATVHENFARHNVKDNFRGAVEKAVGFLSKLNPFRRNR